MFKAPLNDTHHYFFSTGDCFEFEFNQPIFKDPVDTCFDNYECKIIDPYNFRVTLVGSDTPKLYGKVGRLDNPTAGLQLKKVVYLDECIVPEDESHEVFEIEIGVSMIKKAKFNKGEIIIDAEGLLSQGSIMVVGDKVSTDCSSNLEGAQYSSNGKISYSGLPTDEIKISCQNWP